MVAVVAILQQTTADKGSSYCSIPTKSGAQQWISVRHPRHRAAGGTLVVGKSAGDRRITYNVLESIGDVLTGLAPLDYHCGLRILVHLRLSLSLSTQRFGLGLLRRDAF